MVMSTNCTWLGGRYDCSEMVVCTKCCQLRGRCKEVNARGRVIEILGQRCTCSTSTRVEPLWPRRDFNEVACLCRCCNAVILPSGSKFSVWFCESCKAPILKMNELCQQYMIPIGRHSLMASTTVRSKASCQRRLETSRLTNFLEGIGGHVQALSEFSAGIVREYLQEGGWENARHAALPDYLAVSDTSAQRRKSILHLIGANFGVPRDIIDEAVTHNCHNEEPY